MSIDTYTYRDGLFWVLLFRRRRLHRSRCRGRFCEGAMVLEVAMC